MARGRSSRSTSGPPVAVKRILGGDGELPSSYMHLETRSVLNVDPAWSLGRDGYWISRVQVPAAARGTGVGRALMAALCEDADAAGAPLWLAINAYGDLDYEQLAAWYIRCGFVEGEEGLFCRPPVQGASTSVVPTTPPSP